MRAAAVSLCALICAGLAGRAEAQQIPWEDRVFINLSGGAQSSSQDVALSLSFPLYAETATVDIARTVKGSGFFDVAGGARVWGNLGVAANFNFRRATGNGTLVASIPDPIRFDQPRAVNRPVPDLVHEEKWTAIQAVYVLPVAEKLDIMVMGGPAVVAAVHDLATDVLVTEDAAGPVVTVALTRVERSFWGFRAGVDVTYMVTRRFGGGGFIRYSSATGNLTSSVKYEFGGFEGGGGLRVRF